jgi:hypothetical protein
MNFEQLLSRVADRYQSQGYRVDVQPRPEQLPEFAKDFQVEIVARREDGSALVAAKKTYAELKSDLKLSRDVEITEKQPGWRFDLIVLTADNQILPEKKDARELSVDEINRLLGDVERMLDAGFAQQALISAWAGLEAVMRRRLRSEGEDAGWDTSPRTILNVLYSHGILKSGAFRKLEDAFEIRNAIAHGFASPDVEPSAVQFLISTARSLLEELPAAKLTA